ncbi:hypothetical protein OE88DRAFT_1660169 [Heliocybe sulcata]|uniref:Uncharacterized protein n=1 Tax=Heliocybe sulcata TaxID=5364 RepID=A0A5C3NAX9_9AGAM|nr:hypothetical protein OE88DRAFT_1660169 [Heliocybe sulcata]
MLYPSSWVMPPRRLGDDGELAQVPHDVWLEVVNNLRPSESQSRTEATYDLANLSLACRYFCAITRPLLFEEVVFTGATATNDDGSSKDHSAWFKEIRKNPDKSLASFVKTYRISGWGSEYKTEDAFLSHFCAKHFDSVVRLPNLQNLYIERSWASERLFDCFRRQAGAGSHFANLRALYFRGVETPMLQLLTAMQGLVDLHTLVVQGSLCSEMVMPEGLSTRPLPSLRHLELCFTAGVFAFSCLVTSWIIRVVCQPSLRVFKTNCEEIAQALLTCGLELAIEELKISVMERQMRLLPNFLRRTPSIHTLTFRYAYVSSQSLFIELDDAALPNLRALCCDGMNMLSTVKGRPVSRYRVGESAPNNWTGWSVDVFLGLKQSRAPVEELTITAPLYHDTPFADHFHDLKSVTVFGRSASEWVSPLYIEPRRDLRAKETVKLIKNEVLLWEHFQVDCVVDMSQFTGEQAPGREMAHDLRAQQVILANEQFAAQFPCLLRMGFCNVEWRRSSNTLNGWKPYITSREEVRKELMKLAADEVEPDDHPVVDVDSLFASLFRPRDMTARLSKLLGLESSG